MPESLLSATMLPVRVTLGQDKMVRNNNMPYLWNSNYLPTDEYREGDGAKGASIEIPDIAKVLPRRPGHGGNTNLQEREGGKNQFNLSKFTCYVTLLMF
jgi:hypothetical protein